MDARGRNGGCAIKAEGIAAVSGVGGVRGALLLSKPGIVVATALSGYAGMVLAARGVPPAGTAIAGVAALVLAAAGAAAINGVLDLSLDCRMARLGNRVAALAELGKRRVFAAACVLITLALALAAVRLNLLAAGLIAAAVLSYTVLYTLRLKRRSPFGAVPGGIPGALPVLIGYASVSGTLRADALVLFAVMLLWQPPHFWALALAYRDDYRAAGVPVLPVAMGERYTKVLIFIYATALVPASLGLWFLGTASAAFAAVAVLDGIGFLGACYFFALRKPRYVVAFRASILYLTVLLLAVIADVVLA